MLPVRARTLESSKPFPPLVEKNDAEFKTGIWYFHDTLCILLYIPIPGGPVAFTWGKEPGHSGWA